MKVLISGHRKHKIEQYDEVFIRLAIDEIFENIKYYRPIGLSGMADGVDLWFCQILKSKNLDYWCYIPFENQDNYMTENDKQTRKEIILQSRRVIKERNSKMVEDCDKAIIVWDGNKGGTHNVMQQIIEKKKDFWWINPVKEKVYYLG